MGYKLAPWPGSNQVSTGPVALRPIDFSNAPISQGPIEAGIITAQPPSKKGLLGKLYSAVVAIPKVAVRELTYTLPTELGHLSAGDSAAAAAVPGFTRMYKEAYQEATNPALDTLRLIMQAAKATPTIGEAVAFGARAAGYATVGAPKERYEQDLLATMRRIASKEESLGSTFHRLIEEHYPEYGSGFSIITYTTPRYPKQVATARIPNTSAMDWAIDAGKRGYNIRGVDTMEPVRGIFGTTLADKIAFLGDVSDPILAVTFGTAARLGFKALGAAGRLLTKVPGVGRGVQTGLDAYAAATKTGTWLGSAMDKIDAGYGSIRLSTARLRQRVYGMAGGQLESVALKEQLREQAQTMQNMLAGQSWGLKRIAQKYLDAEAVNDTITMNQQGIKLINHGGVGLGGDVSQSARTIINIANMPTSHRELLGKLALAWREGDTVLEDVLARIEKKIPKESPAIQKAYRDIRGAAAQETRIVRAGKVAAAGTKPVLPDQLGLFPPAKRVRGAPPAIPGLQIGDVEVIANALTLPRGGLGVMSNEIKAAMDDYVKVVQGAIPAHLIPTAPEIEAMYAKAPGLAALEPAQIQKLAAGNKLIDTVCGQGMSEWVVRQMKNGLERSVATNFGGATPDLAKLVDKWILSEAVIKQEAAMGAFVKNIKLVPSEEIPALSTKLRSRALQVRAAVEKEAAAQGISRDVLHNAVKLGANLDEQIGKMEVDLGIITKGQFDGLRGLHIRRSYELFPEIEKRLYQLEKTDPVKYARIENEYNVFKQRLASLENANITESPGGVGTTVGLPRKDLTPEFRLFLEQMQNYGDALLLSGRQAAKSISNATFYKAIYEAGLASDVVDAARGFTEPIGKSGSWAALAGKWTSKPIAADLKRFATQEVQRDAILGKIWTDYIITPIKMTLVPINYVARMHNMMSNYVQYSLGIGDANLARYVKWKVAAGVSLLDRGPMFQLQARYSPSVREASIIAEMNMAQRFGMGPAEMAIKNNVVWRVGKVGVRTMAWEEALDKHAFFLRAMAPIEEGGLALSARNAALEAEKWIVDYTQVPPVIDWLRRKVGITPFITYTYKMASNLIRGPLAHPEVIAQIAKPYLGMMDMVPENIRSAEKEGIPEYLHGKVVIRLPGKEARYVNLDPYLPWSAFSPDAMAQTPPELRAGFGLMGPPFSTIIELGMNRNKLTGADIVPEGADEVTAAKLRMEYLMRINPQMRQIKNFLKAVTGNAINSQQKPQRWYEAIMEIHNYDVNKVVEFQYKKALNEYQKILSYATQTNNSTLLDESVKEERVTRILQFADQKRQEIIYMGQQMVQIAGLDKILAMSGADPKMLHAMMQTYVDESPDPTLDLRKRLKALGQTLIPGQSGNSIYTIGGTPGEGLAGMQFAPWTGGTPVRPLQQNQQRMIEANEGMQPKDYTIPAGYAEPRPGPK